MQINALKFEARASRTTTAAGDCSRLLFVNVAHDFGARISESLSTLHRIEFATCNANLLNECLLKFETADAVLLGSEVADPVGISQRIHAVDKRLPIVILSGAEQCALLRQDLMFNPFIGHEIIVWPMTDIDGIADVLADAAERRRQRLRYQEAAMANAHVQLEVLPLLRPETAEYVGSLFDHEPIGVIAATPDGKILKINRHAQILLGVTGRDVSGSSLLKLFPADEKSRLQNLLSLALQTNGRLSPELFEVTAAKDKLSYIEVTAAAFPNPAGKRGAMLVLQEVTLRVQSERQRSEAVVELRLIANSLRKLHAISTHSRGDLKEKISEFLRLGCDQFGLPIGFISEFHDDKLTILESVSGNPKFAPGAVFELGRTYCSGTVNSDEPLAFELASATAWRNHPSYKAWGQEAFLGTRITIGDANFGALCFMSSAPHRLPFSSAQREIVKLMSRWIAGEIERERAEAHMRKLSSAIEQTADSVLITDRRGIVEYLNPSFEKLTGFSREEVIGSTANFLRIDENTQSELWSAIGQGSNFRFLLSTHTKGGELYHEQMTISPLKDDNGTVTHLIATGQDVTALVEAKERERKSQAELIHVARLSTLGGMVSGLAHELNQPLCAMMTYAQTCLRKMRSGEAKLEDLAHGLNQIIGQAERADAIFSRIRDFSRKRQIRRHQMEIRPIVETSIGFIQTELEHNNVQLDVVFPKKMPVVFVDMIQIQQVILNLIRNSLDALTETDVGKRKISVKVTLDDSNFTKVAISDTGSGCPTQELHRLFEPFFTTKEAGLGVGLSISQGIVEGHGGKLWLASSSPKGSTFCLTLPSWNKVHDATSKSK